MGRDLEPVNKDLPAVASKQLPAKPLSEGEVNTLGRLFVGGDMSKLDDKQKWLYYKNYCDRLGLDPYTRPFKLISAQGKQIMYADSTCADQLAARNNLTCEPIDERREDGVLIHVVKVYKAGEDPATRREVIVRGAVTIENLKGESLANALMKCETKAFRRGVLRYCGLGARDEGDAEPSGVEIAINEVSDEAPEAKRPTRSAEKTEASTASRPSRSKKEAPPPTETTEEVEEVDEVQGEEIDHAQEHQDDPEDEEREPEQEQDQEAPPATKPPRTKRPW
jgi:hypothetical protein